MTRKLITIMTPCFNEVLNVRELHRRVLAMASGVPEYRFEHLFIDNCSVDGTVSLLVFFDGAASQNQQPPPIVVASAPETGRLQPHDPSGVLGFNWGIDPASPQQVHDAQIGLQHRPPRVDHDALADSIVEGRTTYRFFSKTVWTVLEMPE